MKLNLHILLATCLSPVLAIALPQGGVVSGGVAVIDAPSASQLSITQGSERAVIDWSSFNVGAGERVSIAQPSASAVLLNRIGDANPSQIHGQLSANGNVILANPNGMVFGPTSQVDVGGLIATTSRFGDTQGFLNGGALPGQPGNPRASITQQGVITVRRGGLAALVAPGVQNEGLIVAEQGKVTLAGADTVSYDLYGDGLVSFASKAQPAAYVGNTGTVRASQVVLSAAQASQLVDSAVNLSGVVDASSLGDLGGTVTVTGDQIAFSGKLDASGATGGGKVNIGGGWQGGGTLPWAKTVSMTPGAHIDVSAKQSGKGGEAVLWSSGGTTAAGTIHAKGGATSGDGGRIETSGLAMLDIAPTAKADASAANGAPGLWLLDPNNIVIHDTLANANVAGAPNYTTTANSGRILDDNIRAALNGGTSVTITTGTAGLNNQNGDITTTGTVDLSTNSATDVTLTLRAHRSITLTDTTATASGAGKLNLVLWSNFDGDASGGQILLTNSNVTTNGGFVHMAGGLDDGSNGGAAADGRPDGWAGLVGTRGIVLNNSDISTGIGSILLRGQGNSGSASNNRGVMLEGGASLTSTNGNITLIGRGGDGIQNNQGIYLLGNNCVGGVNCTEIITTNGAISLTGTGGADQDTDGAGPDIKEGTAFNDGIRLENVAQIITNGTGNIILNGTAADGTNNNRGVFIINGSRIDSTSAGIGAGTISLNGNGGQGASNNYGVALYGNNCIGGVGCTEITSARGNITLNGVGGADQDTDGAGPDTKDGSLANVGVYVDNFARINTAGAGAIDVTGIGGNGTISNIGILMMTGASINSSATGATAGTITLNGTGGNGTDLNFGIYLSGNGCAGGVNCTQITSTDGNILINGTGQGNGGDNRGYSMNSNARLISSGTTATAATITINGNGSATGTTSGNHGITSASNAVIETTAGNVSLTGNAGTGNVATYGTFLRTGSSITSLGTNPLAGTLSLYGTGSSNGAGVRIEGESGAASVSSVDGAILLQGTAAAGYGAVSLHNGAVVTAQNGSTTLRGTRMAVMGSNNRVGGAGSTGTVLFDGMLEGHSGTTDDVALSAGALTVQTTGTLNFAGATGSTYRLDAVNVSGTSGLTAGGAFNSSAFTYNGTGPVDFTAGTGLNATGNIAITTTGNMTGTYTGGSGRLYAGAGSVNATVNFGSLDINGASATLTGAVGPGGPSQEMADRITVNGSRGPGTPTYRFAGYNIGVNMPPSVVTPPPESGGVIVPPVLPVPELPPVEPEILTPADVLGSNLHLLVPGGLLRASNNASDTPLVNQPELRRVGSNEPSYLMLIESNNLDARYYGMSDDDHFFKASPDKERLIQHHQQP